MPVSQRPLGSNISSIVGPVFCIENMPEFKAQLLNEPVTIKLSFASDTGLSLLSPISSDAEPYLQPKPLYTQEQYLEAMVLDGNLTFSNSKLETNSNSTTNLFSMVFLEMKNLSSLNLALGFAEPHGF